MSGASSTLISGLAGALALRVLAPLERAALGRAPVWDPAEIAGHLARVLGASLGHRTRRRLGALMQVGYAAALSATTHWLGGRRRSGDRTARALLFGTAVATGELVGLPLVGATPATREWQPRERLLLFVHAITFALVATSTESVLLR